MVHLPWQPGKGDTPVPSKLLLHTLLVHELWSVTKLDFGPSQGRCVAMTAVYILLRTGPEADVKLYLDAAQAIQKSHRPVTLACLVYLVQYEYLRRPRRLRGVTDNGMRRAICI